MKITFEKIKQVCNNYLGARKEFLEFANLPEAKIFLDGNDNIIGSRIGEFIAWKFLEDQKRKPKINNQSNVKDFDIICGNGPKRVSVKLIGPENKAGRTTRLGDDWDEFILILLNKEYKIDKIGQINRKKFDEAVKTGFITKNAYVSRSMLGAKGLFNRNNFGVVYSERKVKKYL